MNQIITLNVNGIPYKGWKEFRMVDSLQAAASAFELTTSERWQGTNPYDTSGGYWRLRAHDACELFIDDVSVLKGWIDVHQPSIDKDSHNVSISGRSLTGDLVDCSATDSPSNFKNQNALQIAGALVAPFSVSVYSEAGTLPNVKKFEVQQGESVYEAIERLCRLEELIITSRRDGNLSLERGKNDAYSFPLSGYESASLTSDYSRRFSKYIAKAQQHGENLNDPDLAARVTATVTDNQITRYRPKIIRPEGSTNAAQARQRISWQANRDLGSSLRMRATMTGFYNPDGDLWQKNKLITVNDKWLGINNVLLIESVTFKQAASENQGSVTELTLVHPSSYAIEPAAEEAPTKRVASKKAAETSTYFDL